MSLTPSFPTCIRTISPDCRQLFSCMGKNIRKYVAPLSKTADFLPREDVQCTSSNAVTVATVETNKPISKLAVYFRAGSRYEDVNSQGIVHALRIASGLGTKGTSKFGITRHIEFAGGNLFCTAGREHVAYTLEATRDKIEKLQQIFQDVTVRQAFKRWEVSDALPRLKYELDTLTPEVRVLEMLHREFWKTCTRRIAACKTDVNSSRTSFPKFCEEHGEHGKFIPFEAAFRRGLGNSLYSPRHMVGRHSSVMLENFVKRNFVEASIVGVNVPQESVAHFAQSLGIVKSDNPTQSSKFYGDGDIRKEIGGNMAYVAIALEGARLSNQKEALTAAVAQRALGSNPRTKRGISAGGKLATVNGDDRAACAFSATYSDAGLLGVLIMASPNVISNATNKAAGILREANFSEDEVARGRNSLKADIANSLEAEWDLTESIGLESLLTGSVNSHKTYGQVIDSVTVADVNNIIKKSGGKLSLAAMGNIGDVPYVDELN